MYDKEGRKIWQGSDGCGTTLRDNGVLLELLEDFRANVECRIGTKADIGSSSFSDTFAVLSLHTVSIILFSPTDPQRSKGHRCPM